MSRNDLRIINHRYSSKGPIYQVVDTQTKKAQWLTTNELKISFMNYYKSRVESRKYPNDSQCVKLAVISGPRIDDPIEAGLQRAIDYPGIKEDTEFFSRQISADDRNIEEVGTIQLQYEKEIMMKYKNDFIFIPKEIANS